MTPSGPIRVKSGETLHDVWAIGDGGPSIEVDPGATGWTIDGFDIGAPRPTDSRPAWRAVGIAIYGGSGGTIRNGRVRDAAAGVYAAAMEGHLAVENMHISGIRWDRPRAVGVQLNQCKAGALIEGVVSDASLMVGEIEDHINLHACVGTLDKPFVVRHCWVRGGGLSTAGRDGSGCGINVGDGGGAWFEVSDNVLVDVANAAIGMTGGRNGRICRNLVFGWGPESTQTRSAVVLDGGASQIYVSDNRALVRAWMGDGAGRLGAGFWHRDTVTDFVEERNNWQDATLSDAIWTPPEIYHMTDAEEKVIAAREDMLAAWRAGTFFEDVRKEARRLADALTALGGAQLVAAQSVAKDSEQMRASAEKAPAAQRASDIARDAMLAFTDRVGTTAPKGEAADVIMRECVRLAAYARQRAEAP